MLCVDGWVWVVSPAAGFWISQFSHSPTVRTSVLKIFSRVTLTLTFEDNTVFSVGSM
jgi:hypothetical protein